MTTGRKTLDPKLDIVFLMLFGEERNRELLLSLLNAVLQPAGPITKAEVVRAEPERSLAGDKTITLDVRITLGNGERVDIEMQSQAHPGLRERLLYYWARLYGGQLLRGEDYLALRRSAVILFADFEMLTGPRFHSIFRIQERHTREVLSPHLEIHILELPKLDRALDRDDEPRLALWGKFLNAQTDADLEALAMQHPVFDQAKKALDELSADPKAREQAEMREMALISYKLGLTAARESGEAKGRAEGEAKGRAEGEAKGRAQMLRRLLTLKFGDLPSTVERQLNEASSALLDSWFERAVSASHLEDVLDEPRD